MVFLKWPITGILIEFVGFVGLFGSVCVSPDYLRRDQFRLTWADILAGHSSRSYCKHYDRHPSSGRSSHYLIFEVSVCPILIKEDKLMSTVRVGRG